MLNNKDFYPTPGAIAEKMLDGIEWSMIESILEPSAGKGDLVDKVKEKEEDGSYRKRSFDIDCIESDTNLQHILKGKGYKVVHDDFLTYDTMKRYSLIIMNPPFSNGDKHLLKAIEMQEVSGGAIVCLLNAETLKNPYSNARLQLQRKLDEYEATINYIEDGFISAERKTNVEVALIKILIPEVNKHSFIYERLKEEQQKKEIINDEKYSIIGSDFIKEIVKQYELEVKAGVNLINEYYAISPYISNFSKGVRTISTLKLSLWDDSNAYSSVKVNEYIEYVRSKYWKELFSNEKFIGQLTSNLRNDFYNQIDILCKYEFSLYNIYEIKFEMLKNVIQGIEETIFKLFEEFSRKYHWYDETSKNIRYYNGWKTNKSWIINKKVIIPLNGFYDIKESWGRYEPDDYKVVNKLTDIEKALNYLDGGLTESIDLITQLKRAKIEGRTKKINLRYFTVTFFKKGTCHIEFTNLELLKKLNIFGSQKKGWLPPSYAKAKYEDMSKEEQEVINGFEGEKSYQETLINSNYYIFSSNNIVLLEQHEDAA